MSNRQPQYRYWQTESDGLWRFALLAGNYEPLGPGQGYRTRAGVLSGIEAHRRNAASAAVVRVCSAPSAKPASLLRRAQPDNATL